MDDEPANTGGGGPPDGPAAPERAAAAPPEPDESVRDGDQAGHPAPARRRVWTAHWWQLYVAAAALVVALLAWLVPYPFGAEQRGHRVAPVPAGDPPLRRPRRGLHVAG